MTTDLQSERPSLRTSSPSYVENFMPLRGVRPPRARTRSDAPELSLNGTWHFRYAERADGPVDFTAEAVDTTAWSELPVPAHWQLHG